MTKADVDQMFLDRAYAALNDMDQSALEFLAANPGLSKIELAQRLNRGTSAIGLVMAIYKEASECGNLRAVAKDLLIREIRSKFPNGRSDGGDVASPVCSWQYETARYANDSMAAEHSFKIARDLVRESRPPEDWLPAVDGDALLDSLFDRHWPNG